MGMPANRILTITNTFFVEGALERETEKSIVELENSVTKAIYEPENLAIND
jgi:hypothetical protein